MSGGAQAVHFVDLGADGQPKIELDRLGPASFRLKNEFRIFSREHGTIRILPHRTDLTSSSRWNAWLVPRLGPHTPASIAHDAMIDDHAYEVVADSSKRFSRDDADRIYFDLLGALGVTSFARMTLWSATRLASGLVLHPYRAWLWVGVAFVSALLHFLLVVDVWDWHPLIDDWPFLVEWPAAVLSALVVGFLTGVIVAVDWRAFGMQSLIWALAFVPVVPMIPVWLAMALFGSRISRLLAPRP